jgi:HAD superfamily hydrolase (TIGR01490 family)
VSASAADGSPRPVEAASGPPLPGSTIASAPSTASGSSAPSAPTRAAAFFDLDNTVMEGASVFHLVKGMYRRGFFSTRLILKGVWLQTYFRTVGREKAEHIEDARSAILGFIEGHSVAELQAIGDEVYEESIARRIWPGARALVQWHLEQGQQVWLVTAAPIEVAAVIAARLGITGALGTTAEHLDGVYTGRLRGELLHGPVKATAVQALAEEYGLDLGQCYAYSDSSNDLPMLTMVGNPSAVNPDRRLRTYAEEHDWPVREFRTGRRAVRLSLLGAGAATGVVAGGLAARRAIRTPAAWRRVNAGPRNA